MYIYVQPPVPVSWQGLSLFLSDMFIIQRDGSKPMNVQNVLNCLKTYPNLGSVVYKRPLSQQAQEINYLQTTILQLKANLILHMQLTDDDPKASLVLTVEQSNASPHYLFD